MGIPFNPFVYWLIWFVTYGIILTCAYRRRQRTRLTIEQIVMTAGFSLASVFALLKVLINLVNFHEELQEKLDWEGITALSISCILGIAIALKEIRKLL
jgi:hypothetical protein